MNPRRLIMRTVSKCIVFSILLASVSSVSPVNIGGIFSSAHVQDAFKEVVRNANADPVAYDLGSTWLNSSTALLNSDPIVSIREICSKLINNSVYAVLTDRLMNNTRAPYIVSYACAFYNIPVIGVASRESQFSDKTIHGLFVRTVPSYADEARPMNRLVAKFNWSKVILVTSSEYDYRQLFVKFTSLAYDSGISIEQPIIFETGTKNFSIYLKNTAKRQSKVIVFAARGQDAVNFYKAADSYGLTSAGYIWIVCSEATDDAIMKHAPQGLLTVRPIQEHDTKSHIRDAVRIVGSAISRLSNNGATLEQPPSSCDEPPEQWALGKTLFKAMVNRTFANGATGTVNIDPVGDRVNAAYEIFNLKETRNGMKFLAKVGNFNHEGIVSLNDSHIVWPGNQTEVPKGVFVSAHLKIVTAESHPFITAHPLPQSKNCSDINLVQRGRKRPFIKCVGPSTTLPGNEHCCTGFCVELLIKLANKLNFTYDVYFSPDKQFGSLVKVNGSDIKQWNGAVGEVVDGKADLIVASLTINNERAQYIEFSKPFKYQGIAILVKKNPTGSTLVSFLRPFKTELWLLVLLSVHVVAIILYILDRLSPFGLFKRTKTSDEQALDLPSAMWFSWGVLLNSGIGEVTPRSFSARVLGMVWAAFSMIIVASYTANLAAFLVLDRPKPVVSGIDDPNLRNPSDSFPFATVNGSSVEAYFKRQVELSNMYTFMEKHNLGTDVEAIQKVKSGELKAFIWDSPVLLYETSASCDLTIAGDIFGRSGYGIGLQKGSPWTSNISLAILHFHESGIMEQLETSWIEFGDCPKESSSPTTLGLSHMLGVFIMVGVGIAAGVIIVIFEVIYYRRKGMRKEQKDLVAKCAEQWKASAVEAKKVKKMRTSAFSGINGINGINGFELNGVNGKRKNNGYEPDIVTSSK
ncbi:glutamate receptor ionotropic, NMDA 1-like [Rhopilema esculentum]|uniref:glutamate receptor ionotropic, NMDA 1-like n=1 Tax=Rhopilema esculentum TaxID=499914 RepID=UPI0031D8CD56